MCGICGIFAYADGAEAPPEALEPMLASIVHRGPDDEGIHVRRGLALGMRRLSIIDLAGGTQPIANEDGSVVVVFNGEIYNYRELADDLRRRGHRLATASDTEVLVHLYEEHGADCVHALRGMFAFALWDERRARLLIARDRLGIKPLYYLDDGSRLVFGSEIKAILAAPSVEAKLDHAALGNYLSLRYVPAPRTMFEGIRALPPGHLMTCGPDGCAIERYWDLPAGREAGRRSEQDYAEELEELLLEAVRLHLVSDVPFGAFLSGGVDSSLIVALMSHMMESPVQTFSMGFEGGGAVNELPFARSVADRFGAVPHELIIDAQDLVDRLESLIWHLDQPLGDPGALPNLLLAELASDHVKMVLTGEGGDELFGGYARHSFERLAPAFAHVPPRLRAALPTLSGRMPGLRRPKLALTALCQPDEPARFASWFAMFSEDMKEALLRDGTIAESPDAAGLFGEHLRETKATDRLARLLYVDTKLWLPDDLLARGDKTAMAASIEARVPLLDHKVVEFAARLPSRFKVRGLVRKYLLKQVAARWLPQEIITRPKAGFPLPIRSWLADDAGDFVRDVLAPDAIRRRGLFDPSYVIRLLDDHQRGIQDNSVFLFGILSFELWARMFLDRVGVPSA